MLRWSWAPSSGLWTVLNSLTADYYNRRHGCEEIVCGTEQSKIDQVNYFVKQCLISVGIHLCDLADRLQVSELVTHAAFDLVRATILLRPEMLKGRHLYHIVYCAVRASSVIFAAFTKTKPVEFAKIAQTALVMQENPDAQTIVKKFVLRSVSLSNCGGAVLFSDCSGALVLPNINGEQPPEFALTDDMNAFYERVFVPEMGQTIYNIRKVTLRRDTVEGDMGPFPENLARDRSLSPFGFISLSSSLALAMQQTLGQSGMPSKTVKYTHFPRAMAVVSPLGVLPCLLPPIEAVGPTHCNKGDRMYKWMNEAAIRVSKNGHICAVDLSTK
jgi:hypothetical protein